MAVWMGGDHVCKYIHICAYTNMYSHIYTLKHIHMRRKGTDMTDSECWATKLHRRCIINTSEYVCKHIHIHICLCVCSNACNLYLQRHIYTCSHANITLFLLIMLPHYYLQSRRAAELIFRKPSNGISPFHYSYK